MSHRVVQLRRDLVTFAESGLIDLASAGRQLETDSGTQSGGEQEERDPGHDLGRVGRSRDVRDGQPGKDDGEADRGLTAGPLAEQRVRQQENAPNGPRQRGIDGGDDRRDVDRREGPECDRGRGKRM